jgi:hypothetical protein
MKPNRSEATMTIHATFAHLQTLNQTNAAEHIVSKVNRGDLLMLEGFAEMSGLYELGYTL